MTIGHGGADQLLPTRNEPSCWGATARDIVAPLGALIYRADSESIETAAMRHT